MGKMDTAALRGQLKVLPQAMLFQLATSYGNVTEYQSAKRLYQDLDSDTLASIIVVRHTALMKEKKRAGGATSIFRGPPNAAEVKHESESEGEDAE